MACIPGGRLDKFTLMRTPFFAGARVAVPILSPLALAIFACADLGCAWPKAVAAHKRKNNTDEYRTNIPLTSILGLPTAISLIAPTPSVPRTYPVEGGGLCSHPD